MKRVVALGVVLAAMSGVAQAGGEQIAPGETVRVAACGFPTSEVLPFEAGGETLALVTRKPKRNLYIYAATQDGQLIGRAGVEPLGGRALTWEVTNSGPTTLSYNPAC